MAKEIGERIFMENEYIEIAKYYDNLLTSGYYDYTKLGDTLYNILGNRRKILDIGVGTGLLTEKLLSHNNYDITGIDFSSEMLNIAKEKLSGRKIKLTCEDITKYESEEIFEAIISTGGVIYIVRENNEYRLYSHITEKDANKKLLSKLYKQLDKDGLLILAIQGPHKSYTKQIKDDITYKQAIMKSDYYLNKTYTFLNRKDEILAKQFCRFFYLSEAQTTQLIEDVGFKFVGINSDKQFCIYQKLTS